MKTVNKLISLSLCLALLIAVLPINQVYASTSESSQRSTSISKANLEGLLGKDCTSENIKEAKEDIAFLNALHTDAFYLTGISEKDDRLTYEMY